MTRKRRFKVIGRVLLFGERGHDNRGRGDHDKRGKAIDGKWRTRDRDTGLCRRKGVSHVGEVPNGAPGKERRASIALIFREASARKPIRLDWGIKRDPRRSLGFPAGVGLDDQPYSDLRLSPSGLLEPAGRFHRGATRGEVVMTTAGGIDRCLAR